MAKCDAKNGCARDAVIFYRGIDLSTGRTEYAARCGEHELVGEDPDVWSDVDWWELEIVGSDEYPGPPRCTDHQE